MRAVVTNYGNLSTASPSIPQEHQKYAQQILAMDPLDDVPSSARSLGGVRPITLKLEALPPDMQSDVLTRLHALPADLRQGAEPKLVEQVLREKRGSIRTRIGVGRDALPFHQEQVDIARQVSDLARKRDWLEGQIARVRELRMAKDPATGEAVVETVPALGSERLKAYGEQVLDIDRQMRLLIAEDGGYGIEGKKRIDAALAKSAAILHTRAAQMAEEAEAKRRAAEINREDRINKRAQTYARMRRDEVE